MRRLTQEEVIHKFHEVHGDKYDYSDFIYVNSRTCGIIKCNKHGLFNQTSSMHLRRNGCPECSKIKVATSNRTPKEKILKKILDRCKEMNYELVEDFDYKNPESKFHLKCLTDNCEWYPSYGSFITQKQGCPKCSGNYRRTNDEAKQEVLDRCKEMNYELVEDFKYTNSKNTKIHLKCLNDGHKWFPSFGNFINNKVGCPICGLKSSKEKQRTSQEEADTKVKTQCKKKNYILTKKFIYNGSTTIINLMCKKHKHNWECTYTSFINNGYGCIKCGYEKNAELYRTPKEKILKNVLNWCKKMNYELVEDFKYKNQNTKIKIRCLRDNNEWEISIGHILHSKSGCPVCGYYTKRIKTCLDKFGVESPLQNKKIKEKVFNTMIERYGEAYMKFIPKYNPNTIQFIDDLSKLTKIHFRHAINHDKGEKKFHKYWVDAYNEDYNIIIEFDEKHHNNQKENDEERQQYIEDTFGCKFIRVDWEQFINNPEEEFELLVEQIELLKS